MATKYLNAYQQTNLPKSDRVAAVSSGETNEPKVCSDFKGCPGTLRECYLFFLESLKTLILSTFFRLSDSQMFGNLIRLFRIDSTGFSMKEFQGQRTD